jgi:hypothetical protein
MDSDRSATARTRGKPDKKSLACGSFEATGASSRRHRKVFGDETPDPGEAIGIIEWNTIIN